MQAGEVFQLKSFWKKLFSQSWILLLALAVIMAIPRFVFMLKGDYNSILFIFIFMWIAPFLMLTKAGRKHMGLTKPKSISWLGGGFLLGIAGAIGLYFIGDIVFGDTIDHWYNSVMKSFNKGSLIQDIRPNYILFLLISLPTMIFSPIGEEFFFRGMMQEAFAEKWGTTISTFAEASFFAITHLAHHGLIATSFGYQLLPSAFPWIILMMTVSILFSAIRNQSGSIWGAVVCHAGFNFGMMWCIFYLMN